MVKNMLLHSVDNTSAATAWQGTWQVNKLVATLVVCLSTNGERALNHTIVKRLILTTNTQATKIKSSF